MKPAGLLFMLGFVLCAQSPHPRTTFRVKYVAEGSVYLDGGREAGLAVGMKLTVRRDEGSPAVEPAGIIAELEVTAVATTSAVCDIKNSLTGLKPGDQADLSAEDAQIVLAMKISENSRQYAQVVTFTEGDPIDEETRAAVPHRPSPAVNRASGRVGFEYNTIHQAGAGNSSQFGLSFRTDMTRIGGSYWNVSGYWRGRLNARQVSPQTQTISDLINRTYHLTLSYANPQRRWTAGFGRLYLPWASSLDTIDGGYLARRIGRNFTAGVFAGSAPDPTSWNYNPNRQLLGAFVNHTQGSFESVRLTSTAGVAVSRVRWRPERQFAFFENTLFLKRSLSIYHNLQADQVKGPQPGGKGIRLSRSFVTLRFQPVRFLSLDFSHNYFRTLPTFDPRLIGTGLVDQLLFQGASAGVRLELPMEWAVYTSLGRSGRSGDARRSLNQMYGVTNGNLFHTGIRADARYSRFDSAFGRGVYRAVSVAREMGDTARAEIRAGDQAIVSALTGQNRARFADGNADWNLSRHYYLSGGCTFYRGRLQNYMQIYISLGYRF
jgi:hypothetical protein